MTPKVKGKDEKKLKEALFSRLFWLIQESEECERKMEGLKNEVLNPKLSLDHSRGLILEYYCQKMKFDCLIAENQFIRKILDS